MSAAPDPPAPRTSEGALESTQDSTALYLRRYEPAGARRAAVLVLHGYMDHGGRYAELAARLAADGIAVAAPDLRGHGRAAGRRGYVHAFDAYLDDIDAAWATLPTDVPRFVLGHSHGGLLALDWTLRRGRGVAGVIVTNPYLRLALNPPRAKLWLGLQAARWAPWLSLPAGITAQHLSSDPAQRAAHGADPLIFRHANAAWFGAVRGAQERVMAATALPVPLLFITSDADPVASPRAGAALAARLDCPDKTVWVRQGELHEVLHERKRAQLHADIAAWMLARAP